MTYDDAIKVTKGNTQAAVFLVDYINFCHLLDDVVDKDVPVDDARLVKESLNLIVDLCENSWVNEHKTRLLPLIISGFNAWLDSNRMAKMSETVVQSDVVKGIYHEIVYVTAFLCGGYEHMREVSQQRKYDMEAR